MARIEERFTNGHETYIDAQWALRDREQAANEDLHSKWVDRGVYAT
jgi:beta-galactosidase beta subunit